MFLHQAKLKRITIMHSKSNLPEFVYADQSRMEQVLCNYLSNALKYTPCDRKIVLIPQYSSESELLYMVVKDYGVGIHQFDQARLFKPFSKLEALSEVENFGAGLGLYICSILCTVLGGQVGVSSNKNVGTSFWFSIQATRRDPPNRSGISMIKEEQISPEVQNDGEEPEMDVPVNIEEEELKID